MTAKTKIIKAWNNTRFYLSFLLLAFYVTVGSFFLFTEIWADLLPNRRALAGFIIIGFGILRFYVALRRFRQKKIYIHVNNKKTEDAKIE